MEKYEVKITGFGDGNEGNPYADKSKVIVTAGITVQPPLRVGDTEAFQRVILGMDQYGVMLKEVASTPDTTLFIAGAEQDDKRKDKEACEAAIEVIRSRIARLANNPDRILSLMAENPFPIF